MLLYDYGHIITDALCNSHPDFYTLYLSRKFRKLNKKGFSNREIKHDTDRVLAIIKTRIVEIYNADLLTYKKYSKEDKILPKENKYNYPKPDINKIPILRIHFPSGQTIDLQPLTKRFYLDDILTIETALNELLLRSTDTVEVSTNNFPVKSYSLLHVYWSKYDETKKITDTNKLKLSKEYKFSQNTLKRHFDLYSKAEERKPISFDVRAVKPFIKALSGAVKMLESLCPKGFEDAEKELIVIKYKYLLK